MPDLGAGIQRYYQGLAENRMYARLMMAKMLEEQQKGQQQEAFKRRMAELNNDLITRRQAANPRNALAQKKQQDQEKQDKAWVEYVMGLSPNQVPPEFRGRLAPLQQFLANNPSGALAKQFLQQAKPRGLQLKSTVTTETDDEGNEYATTAYSVFDPMGGGLGAVSAPAGMTGPTASEAAPSMTPSGGSSSGLSASAKGLAEKYGLGG